jgi:hypothetical protein
MQWPFIQHSSGGIYRAAGGDTPRWGDKTAIPDMHASSSDELRLIGISGKFLYSRFILYVPGYSFQISKAKSIEVCTSLEMVEIEGSTGYLSLSCRRF